MSKGMGSFDSPTGQNNRWMRFLWRSLAILIIFCTLACSNSHQLSGQGNQSLLADPSLYLPDGHAIVVKTPKGFYEDFVTEITSVNNKPRIPKTLTEHADFGTRKDSSQPVKLDLFMSIINFSHPSGDYYFEAPLLSTESQITNTTTALSWFLRLNFETSVLSLSEKSFQRLVKFIEVQCENCRMQTNSQLLHKILSNDTIQEAILNALANENPNLNIRGLRHLNFRPFVAYSTPKLIKEGFTLKDAFENEKFDLEIILIDPKNSSAKLLPDLWLHDYGGKVSQLGSFAYHSKFDYEDKGTHIFTPKFYAYPEFVPQFQFEVGNVNRNPYCVENVSISFQANRSISRELSSYCYDDDSEDRTLSYSLQSGPNNLTVSSEGTITWIAPQKADGSSYDVNIEVMVTDSSMKSALMKVKLRVEPDHLPEIVQIPVGTSAIESEAVKFIVTVKDDDGDPVILRVRGVDRIRYGFPEGAGSLSNIKKIEDIGGIQKFEITFIPSYLQAIGGNKTIKLKATTFYDPNVAGLDGTIELSDRDFDLDVINMDDPPNWILPIPSLVAKEGESFNHLLVSAAQDAALNPTPLTFSLKNVSGPKCNWDKASLSTQKNGESYDVFLEGEPGFLSPEQCQFVLVAKDANGLEGESSYLQIKVTDVNRPITTFPGTPDLIEGKEGEAIDFDLTSVFDDPDNDPNEDRDSYSYQCFVDKNNDGLFDENEECVKQKIYYWGDYSRLALFWRPTLTDSGSYKFKIIVTDNGNTSASQVFEVKVLDTPAPVQIFASSQGVKINDLKLEEGASTQITLEVEPASTQLIDQYDFQILAPSCISITDSKPCRAGFIQNPNQMSGRLSKGSFAFALNLTYQDGDILLPESKRGYSLRFTAVNQQDPTIKNDVILNITVTNVNRPPVGIGLSAPNFGCVGSSANSDPEKFVVCIDVGLDRKAGTAWVKNYVLDLSAKDPDDLNDSYTFQILEDYAPGSIEDPKWSFKLPSCVSQGQMTNYRTATLKLSDGRGGTISRTVEFKFVRSNLPQYCLQQ